MLNGVHTVEHRCAYPLRALHMGSHLQTIAVGAIAASLDHIRLHHQPTRLAFHLGVHHAAGDHQLNQIHILAVKLIHHAHCVLHRLSRVGHGAYHMAVGHTDGIVGC